MKSFEKWTLSPNQKYVTFVSEDEGGGCTHEIAVGTLLKVLKPILGKRPTPPANKVGE